jgi:hypothetical protein
MLCRTTGSAEAARGQLSELRVRPAGSMAGYSREEFVHWSEASEFSWRLPSGTPDPESCDARDAALIRDGKGERIEEYCDVVSGRWSATSSKAFAGSPSTIRCSMFRTRSAVSCFTDARSAARAAVRALRVRRVGSWRGAKIWRWVLRG